MTEQVFEKTIEDAVNSFGNWAYRYEIIFGAICSVVFIVVGIVVCKLQPVSFPYLRCPSFSNEPLIF